MQPYSVLCCTECCKLVLAGASSGFTALKGCFAANGMLAGYI